MGLFSKSIVGIEMDSREIRAVEVSGSVNNPVITGWGRVSLTDGIIKDGRVISAETLAVYLEKLFSQSGFKSRDVLLGVANQDVIIRFAAFPKVPGDKIHNMVMFQAQEYIPVPLDELQLDYIVAGVKQDEGGSFLNIILVGARKKMLGDFITAFARANLDILEIDSTALAIGRAALCTVNRDAYAVVGFNHDVANILIFNNCILAMARSVPFSQSAAWKNGPEGDYKTSSDMADILINELRSSIGYYRMQNNDSVEGIYLTGFSDIRKIAERFRDAGYEEVEIMQPYTDIPIKNKNNVTVNFSTNVYSAAISLAIRGLGV